MLVLKLNHVCKRGHRRQVVNPWHQMTQKEPVAKLETYSCRLVLFVNINMVRIWGSSMVTSLIYISKRKSESRSINYIIISMKERRNSRALAIELRYSCTNPSILWQHMMTSSNGNTFRISGPLCGEITDYRWIPPTKASDAGLWCCLWCAPKQTAEQAVEMVVIWDALALIVTSLLWESLTDLVLMRCWVSQRRPMAPRGVCQKAQHLDHKTTKANKTVKVTIFLYLSYWPLGDAPVI